LTEKARAFLKERQHNYRTTFNTPTGELVLKDLAKFCRAHETTFHENDRAHVLAEGRREVWLRIQQHLKMTDEEIWALFGQGVRYE